jgi:type I restriction enzyme S subunit
MSLADWKATKLNELGFVGRGKSRHRPRNATFLYGGRYPFFQTGDIKAANFHLTEYSQTYSEEGLAQSKLWKPGTLCITIAANIAETAILGIEGCFPDSVVGFVADPEKADVRFIKYYMEILKLRMQNVSHGATQANLSLDKLLSFDFLVPPLDMQRRIAGILSAYDELIENIQRRINILESMASALYREWFVHFRYPGNESVPLIASPLRKIPQGWRCVRLTDIGTLTIGGDWGKDEPENAGWVRVACLRGVDLHAFAKNGLSAPPIRWVKESSLIKREVMPQDVLIEGSGECGRGLAGSLHLQAIVGYPVIYSNFCKRIRMENSCTARYVEHVLNRMVASGEMAQFRTGTTIPNLNMSALFEMHQFVLPPQTLLDQFVALLHSSDKFKLSGRIAKLRRTRDLLLPRLLSGQLNVVPEFA